MPYRFIDETALSYEQAQQLQLQGIGISLSDADAEKIKNALASDSEIVTMISAVQTVERKVAPKPKFKYKRTAKHKKDWQGEPWRKMQVD
jgi:hypothetical protein